MRHFLSLVDFSKEEILDILALAKKIKNDAKAGKHEDYMHKKILGMIFEKSSTRTRVSFEAGIYELGGVGLFLSSNDIQLGRGEPMKDTARVISRMVDMVMIRTYEQEKLEEFAKYSKVPVINGLTDKYHPVQLMADYLTIMEEGLDKDLIVAYIGDGNNMAHSWLNLAAKLGFELRIATPKAYQVNKEILEKALEDAKVSGAKIVVGFDPKEAVKDATVVTTDTWISMGQEAEKNMRIKEFRGFMVDEDLMKLANKKAIFLHCLPAYRDYEVSEAVLEGPQSRIFDEAENRLHAQKGIMVWLDKRRDS
ncbi:ornithine carbamoyltransferase [Aliarcobacter cibarius]|uniref:Ornithine carbamoyltransferase n=1 Tax=Aliarcobacter cibarius TaxID=255507 RepID=A0A5J6RLE4_9BACT|nr:ornithine carbamoyltransferase [Aliarcobacter cibarius]QEZ89231.1 ornithine carbamoyltransferase [Aliarcobacter cibarius]QKJ27266.1 ornithine carbamoyltransferase [Aliarcobacter cibarius]TLT01517.1 ornithine carbamoyltransferase [Aliarcobacter cibarius]TLT02008.1 ornithine carbamoyltransferase [Aliarcobacter cibarius]TLT04150.1 ornithine carbamoyltransferase [Aliarcobacter cibarius]